EGPPSALASSSPAPGPAQVSSLAVDDPPSPARRAWSWPDLLRHTFAVDVFGLSPLWRSHARGRHPPHSREATEQKPLRVTVHRVIRHGGRRGQASARGRELASTALSAAPGPVGRGGDAAGTQLESGMAGVSAARRRGATCPGGAPHPRGGP